MLKTLGLTKIYPPHFGCKEISIEINEGESVAIIGLSGSGKSTLARLLAGLETPTFGTILFDEMPIDKIGRKTYAKGVQLLFQNPASALNPKLTIQQILEEPLKIQGIAIQDQLINVLKDVELDPSFLPRLPTTLSGGQKQRVNLARALILSPRLLILDESLSSLDESSQQEMIKLLKKIQQEKRLSCLYIAHDLELVKQVASRLYVMLDGKIVEEGETDALFSSPKHPFTIELLRC